MAKLGIQIFSETGTPIGFIEWRDGGIAVSENSNPLFDHAISTMLQRGSALPIQGENGIEYLSLRDGMYSTMKNLKTFLERSFGFKPVIVSANLSENQLELGLLDTLIKDDLLIDNLPPSYRQMIIISDEVKDAYFSDAFEMLNSLNISEHGTSEPSAPDSPKTVSMAA